MSIGFFGGIAGAYQAIQKGIDQAKYRDEVDADREQRRADREYQAGQRQRTVREQKRADDRLDAYRGVSPEGDEVDGESAVVPGTLKPAPANATNSQASPAVPGTPEGAVLAAPATPAASAAPAAPATPPATAEQKVQPKPARRRTYADVLRDYAKIERTNGDPLKANDFTKAAAEWDLNLAGKRLNSIIASADAMPPEDLAKTVMEMYNSDPLPTQVRSLTANKDGSFTGTVYGTESGKEMPVKFKNKDEMLRGLQSMYQPEQFQRLQQQAQEFKLKRQEEWYKPRSVKPGETVQAYNPESGKYEVVAEGKIPAGYEVVEGPNGETLLRRFDKGGTGTGTGTAAGGKGAPNPTKDAADAFELAATKGEVKLQPNQIATGRRITDSLARAGVDPSLSAEVGLEVATDPSKARLELNTQTGEIDMIYQNPRVNRGRPISISPGAGTLEEIEKSDGGKVQIGKMVTGLVGSMVSAVPEAGRQAAAQQLMTIARTPNLREQYLTAAKERGKDVATITRQLDILEKYGPMQQSAEGNPQPTIASRISTLFRGGLTQPTDPNSQAGKFQARQRAGAEAADAKKAAETAAAQELANAFESDKKSMQPIEFARKYDAVRFKLSPAQAAELQRIEKGL